jgi:hypothetical protein
MDNDNQLNPRLSTLNAFASSEREAKERLIEEIQSAVEDLRAFVSRVCTENNKPVPEMKDGLRLGQMLSMALGTFQIIMADLRTQTGAQKDDSINSLTEANKQLSIEKNSLEIQMAALRSRIQELEKGSNESNQQIYQSLPTKSSEAKSEESISSAPCEDQLSSSARRILQLAGAAPLYRVEDLIAECVTALSLTSQETEEHLVFLENEGFLETIKTPTKPVIGTRFPTLFRLTSRGLVVSGSDRQPEAERLLQSISGMTESELPVFIFAIEDYLPKHGYAFVTYLSAYRFMDKDNNPREFIAHAQMQDPEGNTIYIMYEGDGFRNGDFLKEYIRDYSVASDKVAYFLCPSGRMVDMLQGKINYLTHNEKLFTTVNITNIGDWSTYDKMIKTGEQTTPDSIWFGRLFSKGK